MNNTITLRGSSPHLRILVVGRTNAGKTTLLKRLCNSDENPEVFDAEGNAMDIAIGTNERPPHDINNQLIFRSNPHTIFHVSRGFESGSGEEMDKVKKFITQRAASHLLAERLHVIWYCLPTDTNRPFLKAEERFFNNDITGEVPVLMVFTKLDALRTQAFVQLTGQGVDLTQARELTTIRAQEMLSTHFRKPFMSLKRPPADYVPLDDLRKEHADCIDVLRTTVKALSEDPVRLLFVSSQRNSVELCIYHAVAAFIKYNLKPDPPSRISWFQKLIGSLTKSLKTSNELKVLVRDTLAHFPQAWPMTNPRMSTQRSKPAELPVNVKAKTFSQPNEGIPNGSKKIRSPPKKTPKQPVKTSPPPANRHATPRTSPPRLPKQQSLIREFNAIIAACAKSLKTKYPRVGDCLETNSGRFKLIAAICICAEQTSRAGIAGSQSFSLAFSKALDAYMKPSFHKEVIKQIEKLKAQDFLVSRHVQDTPAVVPKLVEIITAHRLRP